MSKADMSSASSSTACFFYFFSIAYKCGIPMQFPLAEVVFFLFFFLTTL